MKFLIFIFFSLLITSPFAVAETRYGLWIEAEGKNQPFVTRKKFNQFLEFIEDKKLSDLYCQVYRGGRAWFPSMLADDTPYRSARAQGFDPLKQIIKQAKQKGQKVHAWVNVLRLAENRSAPLLRSVGQNAILVDSYGNTLLNYKSYFKPPGALAKYFNLDTPGLWLNPHIKEVRTYIVQTIRELVLAYPELDGVHLDMIRSPFLIKNARYKSPHNLRLSNSSKFVTQVVEDIRNLLDEVDPTKELSAAVIAWPDRAKEHAYQNWDVWLQRGLLDSVLPMSYSKSNNVVGEHSEYAVASATQGNVIVGLGAWLMLDNQKSLLDKVDISLNNGADGVALFSFSNLYSEKGARIMDKIGERIYNSPVVAAAAK